MTLMHEILCVKCKVSMCRIRIRYHRDRDEKSTYYYKCPNCEHTWNLEPEDCPHA